MSEKTTAVAVREPDESTLARIHGRVVQGDLSKLGSDERASLLLFICNQLGLNPTTGPIQIIDFKGKATLYVRKDGTDQLRRLYGVSLSITSREFSPDGQLYVVTARASMPSGRCDESTGAVALVETKERRVRDRETKEVREVVETIPLEGQERANALMKAETKAKRRATLSICGLGFLDESEIPDDMPRQDQAYHLTDRSAPVEHGGAPVVVREDSVTELNRALTDKPAKKPAPVKPQTDAPLMMSTEQRERIDALTTDLKATGMTDAQIEARVQSLYKTDLNGLSSEQADDLIGKLEVALRSKRPAPTEEKQAEPIGTPVKRPAPREEEEAPKKATRRKK
jgi:hypothetical protein